MHARPFDRLTGCACVLTSRKASFVWIGARRHSPTPPSGRAEVRVDPAEPRDRGGLRTTLGGSGLCVEARGRTTLAGPGLRGETRSEERGSGLRGYAFGRAPLGGRACGETRFGYGQGTPLEGLIWGRARPLEGLIWGRPRPLEVLIWGRPRPLEGLIEVDVFARSPAAAARTMGSQTRMHWDQRRRRCHAGRLSAPSLSCWS